MKQGRKWFRPVFEDDENSRKSIEKNGSDRKTSSITSKSNAQTHKIQECKIIDKNWMKNFEPIAVEDLAVSSKKIAELEQWVIGKNDSCNSDMLLLTGPVGCGKTVTVKILATKYKMKVTEWITPLDVDLLSDNGEFEYREKQSTQFQDFIIKAANFTSLLDSTSSKLVLVEDFPNTFIRTPSEFTNVLREYKNRAKSPIIFICSESYTDSKNSALNLFTNAIKEQFSIQQISFNSISATGLKMALKRVAQIIEKKFSSVYTSPTSDTIDCVVNSSSGDVRSAVLNLHFASLKGSNLKPGTSIVVEKESKSKSLKRKKPTSTKFLSLGKDEGISILHGVGRVLNPKVVEINGKKQLTHAPTEIVEQFSTQPSSFINFIQENLLHHFSTLEDATQAVRALSVADYMMAEWRDKFSQNFGLYVAVAGVMVANKHPVSAWNPVRGPKTQRVTYPTPKEIPLLQDNVQYSGKNLVLDYKTYCNIINNTRKPVLEDTTDDIQIDA